MKAGILAALILVALPALAQDVLPFPAPSMNGKVAPTKQESVHKWREAPRHLLKDAPNILIVMLDAAGLKLNGDGGIEISVAAEKPEGVPEENWLPINRQDENLDIILRVYEPDLDKMKTWTPPRAEVVK
jgi:hypothetical protein